MLKYYITVLFRQFAKTLNQFFWRKWKFGTFHNSVYEMIKILQKEILNTIYLNWFHNNTSEENNSLIDHSNEPWINR